MSFRTLFQASLWWKYEITDGSPRVSQDSNSLAVITELTEGTGDGNADMVFHLRATAANGVTNTYDLASGVEDAFGNTIVFSKIKQLAIVNLTTSALANINVGGGSNAVPIFANSSDIFVLAPGGAIFLDNKNAGYAVTAGTGDLLRVTASGADVEYDIVIVGVQA